jgi:hypothetical protein
MLSTSDVTLTKPRDRSHINANRDIAAFVRAPPVIRSAFEYAPAAYERPEVTALIAVFIRFTGEALGFDTNIDCIME